MTKAEKIAAIRNMENPMQGILSSIQMLKGEPGEVGKDSIVPGPPGRDGNDGKTIVGPAGRNPLTVSATAPKNPQIGDLWYQN